MRSVRPMAEWRLMPTREAWRPPGPARVMTGTPIQMASQVGVVAAEGKGSRAMASWEEAGGEADQALGDPAIGARRVGDGVDDAVVDGGQAGGVGVADVGDLDWGSAAGEDGEAVAGGVASELDEDVHAVGADGLEDGV